MTDRLQQARPDTTGMSMFDQIATWRVYALVLEAALVQVQQERDGYLRHVDEVVVAKQREEVRRIEAEQMLVQVQQREQELLRREREALKRAIEAEHLAGQHREALEAIGHAFDISEAYALARAALSETPAAAAPGIEVFDDVLDGVAQKSADEWQRQAESLEDKARKLRERAADTRHSLNLKEHLDRGSE